MMAAADTQEIPGTESARETFSLNSGSSESIPRISFSRAWMDSFISAMTLRRASAAVPEAPRMLPEGEHLRQVQVPEGVLGYHTRVKRVCLASAHPAAQLDLERALQPDEVAARGQAFRGLEAVHAGVLPAEQEVAGPEAPPQGAKPPCHLRAAVPAVLHLPFQQDPHVLRVHTAEIHLSLAEIDPDN